MARAKNFIDLTGKKFGLWTVLKLGEVRENSKGKKSTFWLCRCACGVERLVFGGSLTYGSSKCCGCAGDDESKTRTPPTKLLEGAATFNHIYKSYQYRANTKGLDWQLDIDTFRTLTKSNCFYCGIEPSSTMRAVRGTSVYVYNGIDRRDNSKGYTVDNSVPCCKMCNLAKKNFTEEEFLVWAERIHTYQKSKSLTQSKT